MKLRPIGDKLIVKRLDESKTTEGGIIIPDTVAEKPSQGIVVAVGNAITEIKAGDKILFTKAAGEETKMEGKEFLIMEEEKVIAIIED